MDVKPPRTPGATRREFVHATLAASGLAHAPFPTPQVAAPPPGPGPVIPAGPPGLAAIAAGRGFVYGASIQLPLVDSDKPYAALAALECGLLMPDYETKMAILQPKEGVFNFAPIDKLIAWGRAHGKPVRGHGLIWHQDLPDWVLKALAESPARAQSVMETHIGRVLTHTQGQIREWDVLNEVIADPPGSDVPQTTPGELRSSPWLEALGPGYIATALRMAKERDPSVRVALNEHSLEEGAPHNYEKRRRMLNLVRSLRRANVPLDVVGLQGHLQMVQPFSGPPFTAFCRLLRAEGVELAVTEMDIREHWRIPDGFPARDRVVADRIAAFMGAAVDGGVKTFVTWGLEDKYSWLASNPYVKRQDGLEHRSLPFDDDGHRKLYWLAMADAFRKA